MGVLSAVSELSPPSGVGMVMATLGLRIRSWNRVRRALPPSQVRSTDSSLETARSGFRLGLGTDSCTPVVMAW